MIRGLQASFLFFFALAVLTPLFLALISIKPYEEDHFNKLRRDALEEHEEFTVHLEDLYLELIKRIQTTNEDYYNWAHQEYFVKSNRGFPGALNPKIWFGGIPHGVYFFESILPSESVSKRALYRLKYQNLIHNFRDRVAKKILAKDQHAEWEKLSPLLVQIYVFERQKDIFPLTFRQFMSNEVKYQGFKENYFEKIKPLHPAINYSIYMNQLFGDQVLNIAKQIFLFGLSAFQKFQGQKEVLQGLLGKDLLGTRGKFVPLTLLEIDFKVAWNIFPKDWNQKLYQDESSNYEIFQAVIINLLLDSRVEDIYFSLFEEKPASDYLRDLQIGDQSSISNDGQSKLNFKAIQALEKDQKERGISYEIFKLDAKAFSPDQLVISRLFSQGDFQKAPKAPLISAFQGIEPYILYNSFDPFTGHYFLDKNALLSHLSLVLEENKSKINLVDLSRAAQKMNQSLHFRFIHPENNQPYWGTLTPLNSLNNHVVFQYRAEVKTNLAIKNSYQRYFLWMILGGVSALLMGFFLSRKMVVPIQKLSTMVSAFKVGKLESRANLVSLPDEIEQLTDGFNALGISLENSFHQMQTIQKLHELMLEDANRDVLMKSLSKALQDHYLSDLLIMGFFIEGLSENVQDYYFEGKRLDEFHRETILTTVIKNFPHHAPSPISENMNPQVFNLPAETKIPAYFLPRIENKTGGEKMTGFLLLFQPQKDCPLEVLETFCNQAGTIFMKTWLDEIKEDTRHGGEVQQALMSLDLPDTGDHLDIVPMYIPARNLGGDCFDILRTSKASTFGIFIGDVAGKGIGPALFGASAKAYLHSIFYSTTDPGECLEMVNKYLCSSERSDLFLTLFLITIDSDSGTFSYASAGHNNMLLIRSDGSQEYLSAKGLPLGMFASINYETKSEQLRSEDSIILYTDGIPELENPRKELFSQERFEKHCKIIPQQNLQDWGHSLLDELQSFRKNTPASDDITLVTLRYSREIEPI